MARVGIEIPPGLTSDDTSYSTQGTFKNANNFRFYKGKGEVVKGFDRVSLTPVNGVCRTLLPWKDNLSRRLIALGTHSNLYVWRQSRLADVTPVDFVAGKVDGSVGVGYGSGGYGKGPYGQFASTNADFFPKTWSLANFGHSLLANPRFGEIYWWQNDLAVKATRLRDESGANKVPFICNYILVTKERQVLAFGCDEEFNPGADKLNPLCIRGSDIDGNLVEWGVSNANNAFEHILPDGGAIIGARLWGDDIAVWTQSGLYQGTFIGAASQTYQFSAINTALGLLGPNAAVVNGSTAFWLSPDLQLWVCDVGGTPAQIPCPIFDDTLANISSSQGDKVVLSYIPNVNELRIDYPDSRDGLENSRYIALNISEGAWSRGTQRRTAFHRGSAFPHPVSAQGYQQDDGSWVSDFYYEEISESADGENIEWMIETNDFALDENFTAMFIKGFIPDFKNQKGDVELTLYLRMNPQDEDEEVVGPFTISPGQDRVDFMASAKIVRFKLSGSSNPASLRLGRPMFDLQPAGTR